jgi:UDP-glucose 4-epimerase
MATVLVTGGCGFIGSHLSAALRARGDRVRVLDDLSSGSEANLAPGATLMIGDVACPATVRRALVGVDACYHLAAVASDERGTRDWFATHRTNLSGTVAVMEAAREHGIPVVYASSVAVYGNGASPMREDLPPHPVSAYGVDKLGCEQHAFVAGHTHRLRTAGLRFFNVYGPRQEPGSPYSGVISTFCDKLMRGEAVDICGDGYQTRDFVYVRDAVRMLLAALPVANVSAPVFNICTGQPISVMELAATIADLCGQPLVVRRQPARAGEIRHSLGQPGLARARLNAGVATRLRLGLEETLAWLAAGCPGLAEHPGPFLAPARPAHMPAHILSSLPPSQPPGSWQAATMPPPVLASPAIGAEQH